jgi:class 3 adenylate cyclase/tetratricopeptide (TPR) repeat protein
MNRCPACGHENQVGAKFCSECAAPMVEAPAAVREERKVVTVLFADLVGFTSRSEHLDPEDVRALLSPYYGRLRTELERFGGTVEKFIGDAVMAVFGAPIAHEDDAERGVRAALAIRDWVLRQEVDLQLRIAVNTGPALVALGARPEQGEGLVSGDVVNTTARLQTAAPINGILVGETTYRATNQVINYRPAAAVEAKGKAEPVPAWEAVEARARVDVGDITNSRGPLVGRVNELRVLTDALARMRRDRTTQLVTLVGVPGIGKSRLIAELWSVVDADPDFIHWRQGRSLPYGDGVTFWALAEMVKAQAGILETDSPDTAGEKLSTCVAGLIPDSVDAHWVEGHLRPLAGINRDTDPVGNRRDEAFTAWRRFFEALSEESPLVLIFDDLHWADDNLLDFVEYVVDWAVGVPILVVCTTRPELFERRPGWAGNTRNATRLSLAPLTDEETAELISGLSARPLMAADTQLMLLDRAGGNPLFAEQYVRMLAERPEAGELPLPETVQGIIAARIDALPADEKRLLQEASVIGKVFWLGAVIRADAARRETEVRLHALERKDFVQRARRSLVADEAEYAFLHSLVRDVAYGQIPRGERAEMHRLAADWIGTLGRGEDHAEMRAHHYGRALELRRASGQPIDAAFAASALESLRDAGDRAFALNAYATSTGFYQSALELAAADPPERAHLQLKLGWSQFLGGEMETDTLRGASDALLAVGDSEAAAEAETVLAELLWYRGEQGSAMEHLDRARELVATSSPTPVKAYVLASASRHMMLAGDSAEAIRFGREALAIAERLGLDEVRANALINIGVARCDSGEMSGIDDLEQSLVLAESAASPTAICRAQLNLASVLWLRGDLTRSATILDESSEVAERSGQTQRLRSIHADIATGRFARGQWNESLRFIDGFIAEIEAGRPHYSAPYCYSARARIRSARDDTAGALADIERALELARLAKDPQCLYPALAVAAHVLMESGNAERATVLVDEFLAGLADGVNLGWTMDHLHVLASTLAALGRGEELVGVLPHRDYRWVEAAKARAQGDLRRAADICAAMEARTEEAADRLHLAEALVERGRRSEADVELQQALAFYGDVGATRYLREGQALRAASA